MTGTSTDLVARAQALVAALTAEQTEPDAAQAAMQRLRASCADADVQLVWDREGADGFRHYQAIVRQPDATTVSVTACPDRHLPFALRAAYRWHEADVARVNGEVVVVQQAMRHLDALGHDIDLRQAIVDARLIAQALEEDPVTVDDAAVQDAFDAFRRTLGLTDAGDMQRWMDEHDVSLDRLEEYAGERAALGALRDRIARPHIDAYFDRHRTSLSVARIAALTLPSHTDALAVAERARRGESIAAIAQERFVAGAIDAPQVFAAIRNEPGVPLARAVFAATVGDVVGPVPMPDGFSVVSVLSRTPALLDEETTTLIANRLFDEWLAHRRAAAHVEWCWGTSAPPSNQPGPGTLP